MSQDTWIDHRGIERPVPRTKWRLNFHYPLHRALRAYVMIRDKFMCQECGAESAIDREGYDGSALPFVGTHYLVIDHISSRCRGEGYSHHPDNLQVLCAPCNSRKCCLVDKREPA